MKNALDGYRLFHEKKVPKNKEKFEEQTLGQKPEILLVTCSDSRVLPHYFTMSGPGDLFTIENAGNIVVPHHPKLPSESAGTIEYAVAALKVKHVIICGHSCCGAMGAVVEPESVTTLPAVKAMLDSYCSETQEFVAERKADEGVSKKDLTKEAIEHNVLAQISHLKTHPSVKEALTEERLTIHGWVYDIGSGKVREYHSGSDSFEVIEPKDISEGLSLAM